MRILYIDIDTLRADHVGCYGYHRDTTPNIDRIAAEGVRFDGCYASDTPCLPSRTALQTGRFGFHTGVVGHGGTSAEMHVEGPQRRFQSSLGVSTFAQRLKNTGLHTTTISSFPARHSAFHWLAGFSESHDVGKFGIESAHEVYAIAQDWIARRGAEDDWFLHVHFWDPHTPYRAPEGYDPFRAEPLPTWLTEDVRRAHWEGYGPHSARECDGFDLTPQMAKLFPRQPQTVDSMDGVRAVFDGYDAGVRYADDHVGRILNQLADQGVLDDTAVMISADHGETLGELNIYCDHMTADQHTARLPMIVRWPGGDKQNQGRVDDGLHYQFDIAASLLELSGGSVPSSWDGRSFADTFREGRSAGREALVLSQAAWTCQRSVRFGDHLCIHTYHDGYHDFPDVMLFDVDKDPHEQHDLAAREPALVGHAAHLLSDWHTAMLRSATHDVDPISTVLREGGPFHTRGRLAAYCERLRKTDRAHHAEALEARHSRDHAWSGSPW